MRLILLILPLIIAVLPAAPEVSAQLLNSVGPDGKPMPGHIAIEPLSEQNERAFLSSVFSNLPLIRSDPYISVTGEEKLQTPWRENDPDIGAEISRAVIRFRPAEENRDDLTASRTFDLVIDFRPQELVIRHSLVGWKKQKEGDRFTPGVDPQWKGFIKGDFDSQLVVVVPQMIVAPGAPRALFVCPRKPVSVSPKEGKKIKILMDSQYRVAFGLFATQAHARGNIPAALEGGEAYASILTSTSVARSSVYEQRFSGPGAAVNLNYTILGHEQVLHDDDGEGSVVGAMQSTVSLTSGSGLKRVSTVRDTVWVKAVRTPKEKTWSTQVSESTWMPVAPGVCYIIYKEKTITDEFSKGEPLPAAAAGSSSAAAGPTAQEKKS